MKVIQSNSISSVDGSFTRSSTGTYYDITGAVKYAAINEPRFQYINGLLQGILIEQAATNRTTNSNVFNIGAGVSTAAGAILSPDETNTAYLITETAVNSYHYVSDRLYAFTTGTRYCWSVFVKQKEGASHNVCLSTLNIGNKSLIFNFSSQKITSSDYLSHGVDKLTNGWFRIWGSAVADSTITGIFRLQGIDQNYQSVYLGNINEGYYAWGAQIEEGSKPSSYINTEGSSVTRAEDVITGNGLIWTNATNANANWSSATTYTLGQRVSYSNSIYESLQNSNLNKQPDTETTFWLKIGPDNRHAALDSSVSTVSSATGELTFVLKAGALDSLGCIDVDGTVIEVGVTDTTDGFVYSQTYGLSGDNISSWYDYFFTDPTNGIKRTQIVFYDIPTTSINPIVTVRIKNGSLAAKLGLISLGSIFEIGNVQYGATAGIIDYSVKSSDEFGNTTLLKRNFSKRMSVRAYVPSHRLNSVQRFLYGMRATPCIWIASDDPTYEEALIVWGFYKDFTTEISYPTYSLVSVEIEGLS